MKKTILKVSFALLFMLSMCCFIYINKIEVTPSNTKLEYQEITTSNDKVVSSVKAASLVFVRIIDFITHKEV